MDRTFVMVKPDGVQRGLVGEIVSRFEAKGLKLVAARFENTSRNACDRTVPGASRKTIFSFP